MPFTPNNTPTFVRQPNNGLTKITTGTGSSTLVTVYTGGSSNGSKVSGLYATAFGTSNAFEVQWGITNNASTFYLMGTVSVSCGAGSSNTLPTINLLNSTSMPGLTADSDGNPFFFLKSSLDALQAKSPATSSQWAAGAHINLIATVGDF